MKLISLKLENFLSFKSLQYRFQEFPVLVQGENLSDSGQESNGSGKSSIQSAIDFAITKYTVKKNEAELIFWGENEATVELTIYCPIRKEELTIKRTIKLKGSSQLSLDLLRNEEYDPISFATVNDGNKMILDWIGISREDLQNYFILSKERYKSFFNSSNKEKVDTIGRFSNSKILNGIEVHVTKEVEVLESDLRNISKIQTSSLSKVRTLNEQVIFELNRDFAEEFTEHVKQLNWRIDTLDETISDKKILIKAVEDSETIHRVKIAELQGDIKRRSVELESLLTKLEELNKPSEYADEKIHIATQLQSFEEKKEILRKEAIEYNKKSRELDYILIDINRNIEGSVVCPKCSHQFVIGQDVDIDEEKRIKIETVHILSKVTENIKKIHTNIDKLCEDGEEFELRLSEIKIEDTKSFQQKQNLRTTVQSAQADIDAVERNIKSLEKAIEDNKVKADGFRRVITSSNDEIKAINEEISRGQQKGIDQKRIDELRLQMRNEGGKLRDINHSMKVKKQQIFETSQWIYNFKRFNLYLANQSLKVIQGYCNKFLESIDSDIQIKWEGNKILSNGDIREEITSYIIRDGEEHDFWSYSNGERGRLEFSLILTLQKMINSTHKFGGLDVLIMDECVEGIDAQGLQSLMKSLSKIDKTILITTHVVNRSISDNILLIRKENGVSNIVIN